MKINDHVKYIDIKGVEHNALVLAFDQRVEGVVDLVYVDAQGNVQVKYAVHHVSSDAKKEFRVRTVTDETGAESQVEEGNANLPSYALNAYKLPGEGHAAIPEDHPVFDHPFEPKQFDNDGNVIPKARPKYEADVIAQQAQEHAQKFIAAHPEVPVVNVPPVD